jgi:hypothetical protein
VIESKKNQPKNSVVWRIWNKKYLKHREEKRDKLKSLEDKRKLRAE